MFIELDTTIQIYHINLQAKLTNTVYILQYYTWQLFFENHSIFKQ